MLLLGVVAFALPVLLSDRCPVVLVILVDRVVVVLIVLADEVGPAVFTLAAAVWFCL